MSKIKFRAWDAERKIMIYEFKSGGWSKSTYRLLQEEDHDGLFCGNYLDNGDWNEPVLMQYTGLKDKKDKEIWEGDILEYTFTDDGETERAQVLFTEGAWCSLTDDAMPNYLFEELDSNAFSDVKVIGDIYRNPELLKQ